MHVKKKFFWDKECDRWVDKFLKDNPQADVDDLRTFLKESETVWKEFDHVADYFKTDEIITKFPTFAGWFQIQQTSGSYMKSIDEEERYKSTKKNLMKILDDWSMLKSDLEIDRPNMRPDKADEASKVVGEHAETILKSIDILSELSREGYGPAQEFMAAHQSEVIRHGVSEDIGERVTGGLDEIKRRLKLELDKLKKYAEKAPPCDEEEMKKLLAEIAVLRKRLDRGEPCKPVPCEPVIVTTPEKQEKTPWRSYSLFVKGDKDAVAKALLNSGFKGFAIESRRLLPKDIEELERG